MNNSDRRLSCRYLQKPCTYCANDVSISFSHDAIHAYSASVRHNSSLPFVRLCSLCHNLILSDCFKFHLHLALQSLTLTTDRVFMYSCQAKIKGISRDLFAQNGMIYHSYSTFCSFLCTATWRGSLLLPKFPNVLKNVRTPKVTAGCRRNVENLPYGVHSSKIFTVQNVARLLML